MAESTGLDFDKLRSQLDVFENTVKTLSGLVGSLETMVQKHEQLQEQHASLERDCQTLQQSCDHLRQEQTDTARALLELRSSHEALLQKYEASVKALRDLHDRLRNKAYAMEKLYSTPPHASAALIQTKTNGAKLKRGRGQ
jgi:predicted  nucleic acid-binding Zn-ribbon protein